MTDKKIKIVTIVGTRPEIIRLSRTMSLMDKYVNQIIVHTGQNYDFEFNEIFWNEMELRKPDYFFEIDTSSLGAQWEIFYEKLKKYFKRKNQMDF